MRTTKHSPQNNGFKVRMTNSSKSGSFRGERKEVIPIARKPEILLPGREVIRRTGLGHSTIYKKMQEGTFPRQVPVYPGLVRWRERDITVWIQERLRAQGEKAKQEKQRPKPKQKPKQRPAQ